MSVDVQALLKQFNAFCDDFDRRMGNTPVFVKVKEAGLRPAYVAVGLAVALILFALFGIGANAVWYVSGCVITQVIVPSPLHRCPLAYLKLVSRGSGLHIPASWSDRTSEPISHRQSLSPASRPISPFSNLVGFIYPAYCSFKAIKSEDKEDDTQWLTYWVVYAFFVVVESLTDLLLHWIPFYYGVKLAFLVWCFSPQTRGAVYIFHYAIEPLLSKYEHSIDKVASSVVDGLKTIRREYKEDAAALKTKVAGAAASAAVNAAASQKAE